MYFPVWLALYIHREDLRKEMVTMGVLVSIGGMLMETFIWTSDWWHPKTITGTMVGIEDVIFGFLVGGIIVASYEEILSEKLVKFRSKTKDNVKHFLIVIALSALIGSVTFYYMNMHSYYSSILAMIISTLVIFFYRKDLITLSVVSGVIVTLISIPIYCLWFSFDSTAINFWIHENISGIMFIGIPIEDLLWFFAAGMFVSPLYEFWKGEKLEKM